MLESVIRDGIAQTSRDDAPRLCPIAIQAPVTPGDLTFELRQLGPTDTAVLDRVADGVFDGPVVPALLAEFLSDRRHHLIVALSEGVVVGMITAVDYVHPDKPAQLWINEVGVAPGHQRRGIGRALLRAMCEYGRSRGWTEAWLGTEEENAAARGLYDEAGGVGEPFVLYTFDLRRGTTAKDGS